MQVGIHVFPEPTGDSSQQKVALIVMVRFVNLIFAERKADFKTMQLNAKARPFIPQVRHFGALVHIWSSMGRAKAH